MNKLSKVLTLINLFINRPMVTMKTIKRVCRVPERTAYRYINDVSAANFPVVYDKRLKAYRLSHRTRNSGLILGVDEVVMLIAGLQLLSEGLHQGYQDDIESLKAKLVSSQEQPIEEILDAFEGQLKKLAKVNNCSEIVSSLLINTAIRGGCRLKLTQKGSRGSTRATVIENPALNFRNQWRLVGTNHEGEIEIPLTEIDRVTLVR